jgi:hypothetical protein
VSALILRRLPSGRWALLAVPDPEHVATERRDARGPAARVTREDLATSGRLPLLTPLPAVGGRS